MVINKSWETMPIIYPSGGGVIGEITVDVIDKRAVLTANVELVGTLQRFVRSHLGPMPLPFFDHRVDSAMARLDSSAQSRFNAIHGYNYLDPDIY